MLCYQLRCAVFLPSVVGCNGDGHFAHPHLRWCGGHAQTLALRACAAAVLGARAGVVATLLHRNHSPRFVLGAAERDADWSGLVVGGVARAIHFVATPVQRSKALVNEGTGHQPATYGDDGVWRGLCGLCEALSG